MRIIICQFRVERTYDEGVKVGLEVERALSSDREVYHMACLMIPILRPLRERRGEMFQTGSALEDQNGQAVASSWPRY